MCVSCTNLSLLYSPSVFVLLFTFLPGIYFKFVITKCFLIVCSSIYTIAGENWSIHLIFAFSTATGFLLRAQKMICLVCVLIYMLE